MELREIGVSLVNIDIAVCQHVGPIVQTWTSTVNEHEKYQHWQTIPLDPALITGWHAREGGGVWATVRLPLLQSLEDMVRLVGYQEDETLEEEA